MSHKIYRNESISNGFIESPQKSLSDFDNLDGDLDDELDKVAGALQLNLKNGSFGGHWDRNEKHAPDLAANTSCFLVIPAQSAAACNQTPCPIPQQFPAQSHRNKAAPLPALQSAAPQPNALQEQQPQAQPAH